MQFRGHSPPVRQSMRVSWDFFSLSHFVSQFPPTRFPLITAIGMCHFLPVHHLGMAFLAGSKGQNTTLPNQDKIRTLGENETYKYLGVLEADTIKQVKMKDDVDSLYVSRKEGRRGFASIEDIVDASIQ